MSIRRTNKKNQKKFLKENKNLNILDLGCSFANYWPEANHFADIDDHVEVFKKVNLKYTQIKPFEKLPFSDKEFDSSINFSYHDEWSLAPIMMKPTSLESLKIVINSHCIMLLKPQ